MRTLIFTLILVSCSHLPSREPSSIPHHNWKSYLDHKFGSLAQLFPEDGRYLTPTWKPSHEITFDKRPPQPNQLQEVVVNCKKKELWPTHPQQGTKEYLYAVVAPFDRQRLPPQMSSCITPNPTRKYCLRAQDANVLVMSDTYVDNCGNYYRGYWHVAYRTGGGPLKSEDHMGTLLSKGRTQYEKPRAQFAGEYETGYTYPVDPKQFMFLSPLLPGDMNKIRQSQTEATRLGFTKRGQQYFPRGQ